MLSLENFCKNQNLCPYDSSKIILEAFSHFTYNFTDQKMIVSDLRTFKISQSEILLLEPFIFSENSKRFSSSNLKDIGFKSFKEEHVCNIICREMNLKI